MVKLENLYLLEAVLLSIGMNKYIDMEQFSLAENLDSFNFYPWGRLVFDRTINSLKLSLDTIKTSTVPYQLVGFSLALLGYIFETIPLLAERSLTDSHLPQRILHWKFTGRLEFDLLQSQIFDNEEVKNSNFVL